MKRPRILLADDHQPVLDRFRKLLEAEFEVVAAVPDGTALVEAALRLAPDLVITDIAMPGLNGMEAARQIRKHIPEMKLIFLTLHSNRGYVQEAVAVGAAGYVLKASAHEQLPLAVRKVLNGERYATPGCAGWNP